MGKLAASMPGLETDKPYVQTSNRPPTLVLERIHLKTPFRAVSVTLKYKRQGNWKEDMQRTQKEKEVSDKHHVRLFGAAVTECPRLGGLSKMEV